MTIIFRKLKVTIMFQTFIDQILNKTSQRNERINRISEMPFDNRYRWIEDLEESMKLDAQRPKSILFFDIDRFKNVNDIAGRQIGDQVIELVEDRINEHLPETCNLYHLFGDQFLVSIDNTVSQSFSLANQLMKAIQRPIFAENHEFYLTATIGISHIQESDIKPSEHIHQARFAVRHGKTKGGNQVNEYKSFMGAIYNELISLESDIIKAVQFNEFYLVYQPKVDVKTNKMIGLEALLRWKHHQLGEISPSRFIPIAEKIGMIHSIGEWVLRAVCQQYLEWKRIGVPPILIAINVSALELQQPCFYHRVIRIIEQMGMDPKYLEMEITENSFIHNPEECIETMEKLRSIGISLSIDDFGTGYSSIGYLKKFPIDYLKIDQSFLKDVCTDSGSAEIIKSMIHLGHTFGLKVVAEGVEGEHALSFIRNVACDYYQGYFYSQPLEADKVMDKLLTS
ncbi:putative bifunctional diguanylate cyclase/phosphodiesterase [Gracilibacillus dipsosauri]